MTRSTGYIDDFDQEKIEKRGQNFKTKAQNVHITEQPEHLFWFVQVWKMIFSSLFFFLWNSFNKTFICCCYTDLRHSHQHFPGRATNP